MDYNTQFINNVNYSEVQSEKSILIWKNERYRIFKALNVYPGLYTNLRNVNYAVKDRNLNPEIPDTHYINDVLLNTNKLSFSTIHYSPKLTSPYGVRQKNFNDKVYVADVIPSGQLFDVAKLPLNVPIVIKKHGHYERNELIKKIDYAHDIIPYNELLNENVLKSFLEVANFTLLGICATDGNYTVGYTNKNDTYAYIIDILELWNEWNNLFTNPNDFDDYIDENIETFEKFLRKKYDELDETEVLKKEHIDICLLLVSSNIKKNTYLPNNITPQCMIIDGHNISIHNALHNNETINIAFRGGNKIYTFKDGRAIPLWISYDGTEHEIIEPVPLGRNNTNFLNTYIEVLDFSYDNVYSVGIVSNKINSNVITLISNDKIYTYRRAEKGDDIAISFFELYSVSSTEDYDESNIEKNLEDDIANNEYITPSKYYSNTMSFGEFTDGNSGYEKIGSDEDIDVPSWFWSNTLKNWCIFKQYSLKNTFKLYVWNGKNSWICFEDILSHPSQYNYNINRLKFGINFSTTYKYDNIPINYKVVILKYDSKFTQYDPYSFQTLRIGKMWSNNISKNNRYPYTIGIPPVMRLASGEIGLLYSLTISGINQNHPIIYPENIRFINAVCRECFGAGDDKTIIDDWKRIEKIQSDSDEPSSISSMSESTLVDADEINTVKDKASDVSMTFNPFKQYIETDNIKTEAYVERWN